jgi:hypothetical protein
MKVKSCHHLAIKPLSGLSQGVGAKTIANEDKPGLVPNPRRSMPAWGESALMAFRLFTISAAVSRNAQTVRQVETYPDIPRCPIPCCTAL